MYPIKPSTLRLQRTSILSIIRTNKSLRPPRIENATKRQPPIMPTLRRSKSNHRSEGVTPKPSMIQIRYTCGHTSSNFTFIERVTMPGLLPVKPLISTIKPGRHFKIRIDKKCSRCLEMKEPSFVLLTTPCRCAETYFEHNRFVDPSGRMAYAMEPEHPVEIVTLQDFCATCNRHLPWSIRWRMLRQLRGQAHGMRMGRPSMEPEAN